MQKFKIVCIDEGFCRVVYSHINSQNQKVYYCIQDDGRYSGVNVYRCSQAPDPEPDYKVLIPDPTEWEMPTGEGGISAMVRKFLQNEIANAEYHKKYDDSINARVAEDMDVRMGRTR